MSGRLARAWTSRVAVVAMTMATLAASGSLAGPHADANPPTGASQVNTVTVDGNVLRDNVGNEVQLRGADLMSTEYACIGGWGFVAGLDEAADRELALDAMETWGINAVRVPLNADCWFGTKPELAGNGFVGAPYRAEMIEWITQIGARGMVVIVDLHWSAPDGHLATGQSSMADVDTSVPFWSEIALEFGDDANIVFDLFNEPYLNREFEEGSSAPGSDISDIDDAWACWADGCTATWYDQTQSATTETYEAAGMQDLVDAVRAEGAGNVLLISGLMYSQYFDRLSSPTLPVTDPLDNIAISFHAYPGNACGLDNNPCRADLAALADHHPVIVGEFGRSDCKALGIDNFLDFADVHGLSYLGWQWLPLPGIGCNQGGRYDLTKNATTGAPSTTGAAVRTHYLERAWEGEGLVTIATASVPDALAGKAFAFKMTGAGGRPAYRWTVSAGTLPPGLKLQPSGTINGTPVGPGAWTVWIQVRDTSKPVRLGETLPFTITVAPISVTTAALPDGTVGATYQGRLAVSGGKGVKKWTVAAGALPPGLKLAASGAITGRPTVAGSFDVTVRVTDSTRPTANTATRDLTIVVAP